MNEDEARELLKEAWPRALAAWSPYVQLRDPMYCMTDASAAKEQLTGSFAMIRFHDQQVVINVHDIFKRGLQDYVLEILAHEIGHHIYCPANLTDHAVLLQKLRLSLPMKETNAPMVANLYADLLLNDRLERHAGLRMHEIYRSLKTKLAPGEQISQLWQLYMRMYEILWTLESETLTHGEVSSSVEYDARVGARLIRAYADNWLDGAGGFGALLYPYFSDPHFENQFKNDPFFDLENAGEGGEFPRIDAPEEGEGLGKHPALDPKVSGSQIPGHGPVDSKMKASGVNPIKTVKEPVDIVEYGELLKALGSKATQKEVTTAYYKNLSAPHLIPFPELKTSSAVEPQMEGLESWNLGSSMENVDWFSTVAQSPVVIPGVTIVERHFSEVEGSEAGKAPLDLYVGIDCSGSMGNPAAALSYPVLAATIVARSALRSRARVMACLSGESNGRTIATDGFTRVESEILELITDYLGVGYAFGIHRLREHIVDRRDLKPTHLLIVTDQDLFTILEESVAGGLGWDIAEAALMRAGGGGTMLLHMADSEDYASSYGERLQRLREQGWSIALVSSQKEMVKFAREFSRTVYSQLEKRS